MNTKANGNTDDPVNEQVVMYKIAKRPKDDSSDDDNSDDTKPMVNLSLFKESYVSTKGPTDESKGDIITQNMELRRLSEAMRYLNALMTTYSEHTAKERFTEFVSSSYSAITDDFNLFVTKHSDDVLEIAETLKKGGYIDRPCTVRRCVNLRRHCSRNRKAKDTKTVHDDHVEYAVNVIDKYHQMVFHLYDIGLRVNLQNVVEVKEDGDGVGPDEVDKVIAAERDAIAKKKKEFAEAAPDIVEDDEENNKFVIGNTTVLKECMTDGIYREIEKEKESKSVEEMKCYFMENDFDSDAIEQDVEDLNDSNIRGDLKNKPMIQLLRVLVAKMQVHRDELATGLRFKYWEDDDMFDGKNNERIGRVHPKYANLKEEMMNSPFMDTLKWNAMVFKAQKLSKSKRAKTMRVKERDDESALSFDMKNDDRIQIHHIQCVCLYTDESKLCTHFSASVRKSNGLESTDSVSERNSSYYHLSRGLSEAVQMFGVDGDTRSDENTSTPERNDTEKGPFFTGLSKEFIISSFSILFVAPTSTSTKREVALNFAGDSGVIIRLNNDSFDCSLCKFLNVSWFSRFPEEAERLLMHSREPLRMTAIILVQTATNYTRYLSAMFKLDAMLCMRRISPLSVSEKDMMIIKSLCAIQLKEKSVNNTNIPKYIVRCFSLWCERKELVEIYIPDLADEGENYQTLSDLIIERMIGVDDTKVAGDARLEGANVLKSRIFQMFSNLKQVVVFTKGDPECPNKLQYPIPMNSFLSFISDLESPLEYHIYAWGDADGKPTWLRQAVSKVMEQKFDEKGWITRRFFDGEHQRLQTLIFDSKKKFE